MMHAKFVVERVMAEQDENSRLFKVVINNEEQYSIWAAERQLPAGWREAGKAGTKAECLAFIKETWSDMRPLSLRLKMQESKN